MWKKFVRIAFRVFLWCLGISIGIVIIFKFVPVPFTPLMVTRAIEMKLDGKEMVCNHDWVPIEDISKNMSNLVKSMKL